MPSTAERGGEAEVVDLLDLLPGPTSGWLGAAYPWLVDRAPWLDEVVHRVFFLAPQRAGERAGCRCGSPCPACGASSAGCARTWWCRPTILRRTPSDGCVPRLLAALDRLADDERHGRDRVHRGRARFVADTAEMIADVARHGVVPDRPNAATLTRLLADGLQSPLPQLLREVRAWAGRGEPS